jgi:hypothetical protein
MGGGQLSQEFSIRDQERMLPSSASSRFHSLFTRMIIGSLTGTNRRVLSPPACLLSLTSSQPKSEWPFIPSDCLFRMADCCLQLSSSYSLKV